MDSLCISQHVFAMGSSVSAGELVVLCMTFLTFLLPCWVSMLYAGWVLIVYLQADTAWVVSLTIDIEAFFDSSQVSYCGLNVLLLSSTVCSASAVMESS